MALIIPAGYAQCTITYTGPMFDSGNAVSTFGLGSDLLTAEAMTNAAERVRDAFDDNLKAQLDSDVTVTNISVVGGLLGVDLPVGITGTAEGIAAPPNCALLVRKVVSQRGPRAKGRLFAPAMLRPSQINEDGNLTCPALATHQAAFSAFLTAIQESDGWQMYLLQGDDGISPFINPPPIVTELAVQPRIATQRRRMRR